MNGSYDDVRRSIRRWFAYALGDDWTVVMERREVADEERPVAFIEGSTPISTPFARSTFTQGDVQKQAGFSAQCYPTTEGDPRETRHRADALVDLLDRGVTLGLVLPEDPPEPERQLGGPMLLPLYDYDGVDVKGPNRGGPAEPYGVISVEDHTVRPIPDPLDDRRWTVACDVRVTWWQAGRSRRDTTAEPVVASVPPTSDLT